MVVGCKMRNKLNILAIIIHFATGAKIKINVFVVYGTREKTRDSFLCVLVCICSSPCSCEMLWISFFSFFCGSPFHCMK